MGFKAFNTYLLISTYLKHGPSHQSSDPQSIIYGAQVPRDIKMLRKKGPRKFGKHWIADFFSINVFTAGCFIACKYILIYLQRGNICASEAALIVDSFFVRVSWESVFWEIHFDKGFIREKWILFHAPKWIHSVCVYFYISICI